MRNALLIIGVSVLVSTSAWASGFAPKGNGTECSTSACDLNASTTLNAKNICLADGTNCTAGTGANPTANAVSKSTGSTLVDSGIYAVGSNVGIGSTNPRYILDLFSPTGAEVQLDHTAADGFSGVYLGGNGAYSTYLFSNGTGTSGGGTWGTPNLGVLEADGNLYVASYSNYVAIAVGGDVDTAIPEFIVRSTGNVGINTINPRAKLDVDGGIYSSQDITTAGAIVVAGAGASTTSGNLGIGSTTPAAALDVTLAGVKLGTATATYGAVSLATAGDVMVSGDVEVDGTVYHDGKTFMTNDLELDTTLYVGGPGGVFTQTSKRQNTPSQVQSTATGTNVISVINAAGYDIFHIQESASGNATFTGKDATANTKFFVTTSPSSPSYINVTGGNWGVGTAVPVSRLEVDGGIYGDLFIPQKYTTLTTTANVTSANMQSASFIDADMTSGSYTMTMFSDLGNAAIPPVLKGACWQINIATASGTNALTIALDADLTLTVKDAITASSSTLEDKGDWAECCVTGIDDMRCTTYEAD